MMPEAASRASRATVRSQRNSLVGTEAAAAGGAPLQDLGAEMNKTFCSDQIPVVRGGANTR